MSGLRPLPPLLRWSLVASAPLNAFGAVLMSPPGHALRALVGFPDGTPLHQWVLALWVLAFGVAYLHAGWTGRVERGVLALGAWGKAIFVGLLAIGAAQGEVSPAAAALALPDLALAVVFGWGWWAIRPVSDAPGR